MSFSEKLKALRAEKKITQQQLAEYLGVGRPTIAGYETKGKQPDFDKVMEIAEYFNVSTDYLLGMSPIRNPYNEEITKPDESSQYLDVSGLTEADIEKVKEYIELLRQKYEKKKE